MFVLPEMKGTDVQIREFRGASKLETGNVTLGLQILDVVDRGELRCRRHRSDHVAVPLPSFDLVREGHDRHVVAAVAKLRQDRLHGALSLQHLFALHAPRGVQHEDDVLRHRRKVLGRHEMDKVPIDHL